MPYTELHAHSNFSFLEGASHVEELVLRARVRSPLVSFRAARGWVVTVDCMREVKLKLTSVLCHHVTGLSSLSSNRGKVVEEIERLPAGALTAE